MPSVALYAIPGLWKNWPMLRDAEILNQPGVAKLGEVKLTDRAGELHWKPKENGAYSIFAVARDDKGKATLSNVERVAVGYRNVAPGSKISTSSDKEHAALIADDELWTYWSGNKTDHEWVELDLQKPYNLSALSVIWWKSRAKTYRIKVSNDGSDWREIAPESQAADRQLDWQRESDFFRFPPVSARFVRLELISRATEWGGYAIYEVGLYESQQMGKASPQKDIASQQKGKEPQQTGKSPVAKPAAALNAEAREMEEMLRPYLDLSFNPTEGVDKDRPSIRETARQIAEALDRKSVV